MRPVLSVILALLLVASAQAQEPVSPFVGGWSALEAQDYPEAARLLALAVEDDPQHADAHYALALAYAPPSPLEDERRAARALEQALRLDPENVRFLEARLAAWQRTTSEEKAFSMTDSRRPALARRILDIDPGNALAHEELALAAFLEFEWRRELAQRSGGYEVASERGQSGAANRARARARTHLDAALATDPSRAAVHRLRLRLAAFARDDDRLAEAARAWVAAAPADWAARLYLGLAAERQFDLAAAETHFTAALQAMPAAERASFESFALLLRAEEEAALEADSAYAEQFWRERDPRLLSPQNERRLAHYARLALADLLFAEPHTGRRGWETPRGEVTVRYGLPDAWGRRLASNVIARDFGSYESWAYEGEDGFSMLFVDPFRSGEYEFPSSASGEDEATRARSRFNTTPERFRLDPPGGLAPVPHLVATFRGEGGLTDVIVPYGVPFAAEAGSERLVVGLESGLFLLDETARTVAETRRSTPQIYTGDLVATPSATLWPDGLSLAAAPGLYTLAVEFEQARTGTVGVARESVSLPDYRAGGLALSSVLPAYLVEEGAEAGPGRIRRGAYVIQPAPTGHFAVDAPVYLYVEVYGLALDAEGRSQYEVEAVLQPEDQSGAFTRVARRLLGRRPPPGVAIRYAASGNRSDEAQYVILDTADQEPGPYRLTLRVRDRARGDTVESVQRLVLTDENAR